MLRELILLLMSQLVNNLFTCFIMYNININSEFEKLIPFVRFVGEEVLKIYNSEICVDIKEDNSPVTQADILANDLIVDFLRMEFSDCGIISEEVSELDSGGRMVFVIDPIDGTKGFISKNGEFAIMIGVLYDFRPIFGIVYEPVTGRLFVAERNVGSFLSVDNSEFVKLKVSDVSDFIFVRMFRSRNHFSVMDKFLVDKLGIPNFGFMGSIGIKVCKICADENDIYINLSSRLGKWDCCAPQIILEEAGGEVFDKFGNELDYSVSCRRMVNGFIGINSGLSKAKILGCVLELGFEKNKFKRR